MKQSVMWFRRDLRLADNPAWALATEHDRVLPLFVVDPKLLDRAGPFRRDQLLANVAALDTELRTLGGRLHVRLGDPTTIVPLIAGASPVFWNADTTPFARRRDDAVSAALPQPPTTPWGTLFHPPGSVLTQKGTLSRVFTPFYKRWIQQHLASWPRPSDTAVEADPGERLPAPASEPLLPPGADAAVQRTISWLDRVDRYPTDRDRPAIDGTSALSADLHFGTISPRQIADLVGSGSSARDAFVRQLAWRDWYAHLTVEHQDLATRCVRPEYDAIEWRVGPDADTDFEAWRTGHTGYPIVDAGMRQLAMTGWMHNRVRMIVGSFLVKDLLIDWRRGERWFRHQLVDGDYSQNAGNWQWVAGTGPDAAPYFRIFNPITQSRKFDTEGAYIRRFVPELRQADAKAIHAPWEAAPLDLAAAGIVLGDTYPHPIIDHSFARDRTLAAYKSAKEGALAGD